eukprot:Pgem_evm1s17823
MSSEVKKPTGFTFQETNCHACVKYQDRAWGSINYNTDPYISMHIGATVFHY